MSLRLEGDKTQVKASGPFSLLIRYRNVSTNETFGLTYDGETPLDDFTYSFIVLAPSGKDISLAKEMQENSSGYIRQLKPGEIIEVEVNLSKWYSLNEVGTYKITAKKGDMLWAGKPEAFEVVSNPLDVKVVAGE
jgi:hypothetical protein